MRRAGSEAIIGPSRLPAMLLFAWIAGFVPGAMAREQAPQRGDPTRPLVDLQARPTDGDPSATNSASSRLAATPAGPPPAVRLRLQGPQRALVALDGALWRPGQSVSGGRIEAIERKGLWWRDGEGRRHWVPMAGYAVSGLRRLAPEAGVRPVTSEPHRAHQGPAPLETDGPVRP